MLLKDLIHIPEAVNDGDFVLKLSEGVGDVAAQQATVAQYVVTPELSENFREALQLIGAALTENKSKAAILHGSFGSGKSHFMAILHQLLQRVPAARTKEGLGQAVRDSDGWNTAGRKFLLVPYHMIGKSSCEQGILGGYAEFVRKHHPEAATPAVYRSAALFENAQALRRNMGDDAFFAALSRAPEAATSGSDDVGWGDEDEAAGWSAARFEAAVASDADSPERSALVSALVGTLLTSFGGVQADGKETFLDLDNGLAQMSQHAKGLGYDAVVLFLDELILWLAGRAAADIGFVQQEIQKLAKLVEFQNTNRPIPIVSFIARQRDLRELVGDNLPGADKLNFGQIFSHWQGRFQTIYLADQNLKEIVHRRLLSPKDDAAAGRIDASFAETTSGVARELMDIMVTAAGSRDDFRKVYPFSPALVDTLVAVSGLLQRNRTALKVMVQMLSDGRDKLTLGEIIPVGDLFDAITKGREAFGGEWKAVFDSARKLYDEKLFPVLAAEQDLTPKQAADLKPDDPKRLLLTRDERLVKTALLAALVPRVEALKDLTASKLVALNWGAIKTRFGGDEVPTAAKKLGRWQAACSALKLGGNVDTDPTVSIHLEGVDTEAILKNVSAQDSHGSRVRLLQRRLFTLLGFEETGPTLAGVREEKLAWRGTTRTVDVLFGNVSDMATGTLRSSNPDGWQLVIDYPMDTDDDGAGDDDAAIERFIKQHSDGTRTLLWLPAFLSKQAQANVGKLVLVEHVLQGERLDREYGARLSPEERQVARLQLKGQRDQLESQVRNHLLAAYGVWSDREGRKSLVSGAERHDRFRSLLPVFRPTSPGVPTLKQAFEDLVDQALTHQYPRHPNFGEPVTRRKLRDLFAVLQGAATEGRRVEVPRNGQALMRNLAEPLGLGAQGETHFALGEDLVDELNQVIQRTGQTRVTAGDLRESMNASRGLTRDVSDLVLLTFAMQTNRSFYLAGAAVGPQVGEVDDAMELRPETLPDATAWAAARTRSQEVFGVDAEKTLNATQVTLLASRIGDVIAEYGAKARALPAALAGPMSAVGLAGGTTDRLAQAGAVAKLLDGLSGQKPADAIGWLAAFEGPCSDAALGAALKAGPALAAARGLDVVQLETLVGVPEDHPLRADVRAVLDGLRDALSHGELAVPLAQAAERARVESGRLIQRFVLGQSGAGVSGPSTDNGSAAPTPPPATDPAPSAAAGWTSRADSGLSLDGLTALVKRLRDEGREVQIDRVEYRVRDGHSGGGDPA